MISMWRARALDWLAYLCLLCACCLYLSAKLFTFHGVPYLLDGDQMFFWNDALRLMQGQHAYTDFFQFTTPGTDLFYLALFRIFGPKIWVTDLAIVLLGCALCCACFSLSRQFMRMRDALLATGIFLVLIYGRILDATHHWFSLLAVMVAIRVLVPARKPSRLVACGALLGIASFFTQTTGVAALIGICAAIALECRRESISLRPLLAPLALLISAFSATFALLSLNFVLHVGWRHLWYLWVVYASHNVWYAQQFLSLASAEGNARRLSPLAIQRIVVLLTSIGVYLRMLWLSVRNKTQQQGWNDANAVVLAFVGTVLLAAALVKPDWSRIYVASMPAVILFVWLSTAYRRIASPMRAACWAAIALLGIWQVESAHKLTHVMDLPAGRTILVDRRYESEFLWLDRNTKPGDSIVQAALLNAYLPFEPRDPLYVDGLRSTGKTPEQPVDRSVRQVEEHQVQYVIWAPQMIGPVEDTNRSDRLADFRAYLASHYLRIQTFPNGDEVWQRTTK